MSKIFELYKQVANTFGPSGRESQVREVIKDLAKPFVDEITTDALGNLICRKTGTGKKIMLAAHMDSIGVIATYIDDKGIIRFAPIGGLSKNDLTHIQVRFANGTRGVLSYEEKTPFSKITMTEMFIDIGTNSKEQTEKLVNVGDFAVFESTPFMQGDVICGSYMDNRIGCVTLLLAMEEMAKTDNDIYFVFTVQEEVGLRGASTSTFAIEPDYAIAVDVTDTGDLPEREQPMAVNMGGGAAIKVMDQSVLCAPEIQKALAESAKDLGLPVQHEILRFGGTDTAAIQRSRSGVVSGAVSIPTRYIHTPNEMCAICDIENASKIIADVCTKLK